ncbi:hypothetical protein XENOCAPTIV_021035 [Xenoophorus captivus]|uniref:Uncharacterized protein n=1 Tax=Xenoophorus captivus TaxID=1517983 RepID=A0ABV0R1H2_9TELE
MLTIYCQELSSCDMRINYAGPVKVSLNLRPGKDADMPVLKSFKELPDGEADAKEDCQNDSENAFQEAQSSLKSTCKQVEDSPKVSTESDVVQVTRVETYSDTENEDDQTPKSSTSFSEKFDFSWKAPLPKGGNAAKRHGKRDEPKIPVSRTHRFIERSTIEAILYSSKFGRRGRSRSVNVLSVSKQEDGESSKNGTTESDIAEPIEGDNKSDVAAAEATDDEYDGIDCSQPVPSVISGNQILEVSLHNSDGVSPVKLPENMEEAEEPQPNLIPEKSIQSSSKPKEQLETFGATLSEPKVPSESTGISQPSVSSASTSPSRGTPLSSPPSFQMPALFSGLRVLKKGAVGDDREVVSEIKQREKDADLALLSLKKTVNKAKLFPEQKTASSIKKPSESKSLATSKSTAMGQLTQMLISDNHDNTKKSNDGKKGDVEGKKHSENGEEVSGENKIGLETLKCLPEKKKTSDLAYETFKNIFGPKPIKKEKAEDVDLEAVKRKIKNDKESLRLIFERTSKSPGKDTTSSTEATVCHHCI